jgi:Outer membrane protein beta-barrel domain
MLESRIRRPILTAVLFLVPALASAQVPTDATWSVEASVGWNFAGGGNLLSAGIGRLFDHATVIEDQSYGQVYGTGVQWNVGGGYRLSDRAEVRGELSYQSAGARLLRIGSTGSAPLYATFDDYKAFSLDAGYRRYFADSTERLRPYGGATVGVAIIGRIDADLAAPDLNATLAAADFYDHSGALAFGLNGGALYALTDRLDVKGEIGLRHIGGLSAADGLAGTGLETINDNSGRWTVPLTFGARYRF